MTHRERAETAEATALRSQRDASLAETEAAARVAMTHAALWLVEAATAWGEEAKARVNDGMGLAYAAEAADKAAKAWAWTARTWSELGV